MRGQPEFVAHAFELMLALPEVDPERIGVIGFSRGGLLALDLATRRSADIDVLVVMAPAEARGMLGRVLTAADRITAPVLLMVAENDKAQADHVAIVQRIDVTLRRMGISVETIRYPPYGRDGHALFFEVGSYWPDVIAFLEVGLGPPG